MNTNRTLWLLAVLTFGVGDLVTTGYGLSVGLAESHPAFAMFNDIPVMGAIAVFTGVKAVVILLFAGGWYSIRTRDYAQGIPFGLSLLGTAITMWNSYLILSVV